MRGRLKSISTLILVCASMIACKHTASHHKYADAARLEDSEVVLRVNAVGGGEGSKYWWETVRIIEIIKKPEAVFFPEQLEIAVESMGAGLPVGKNCTIYLERYNPSHPEYGWKLVEGCSLADGRRTSGYSHVAN